MEKNKEEWIEKCEEITNYDRYPGSRSIEELLKNGIIILDKWAGPTSHDVAATVKKILCLNKTAQCGTLDPNVTGVLIITLEHACKVMPALQGLDKEYVGIMHLHKDVDEKKLNEAVKKFVGEIRQRPPVRSAVARKERMRKIYSFNVLERSDRDALFVVSCQAGTYIRKLIDDLGKTIGGAHMKELRRTKIGNFDESRCVRIQDIADAYQFWKENKDEGIRNFVLPVEIAIEHLGKIIIKDSAVAAVANGSPLYTTGICRIQKDIVPDDLVAILTLNGELVALARANASSEDMAKRKMLAAKTDRVIMEKGIYPSFK